MVRLLSSLTKPSDLVYERTNRNYRRDAYLKGQF